MPYRFATEREDYADYASGRVLVGLPGHPAFPVRLASEIFQRCLAAREAQGATAPCVLYDPCCGGAYHLATLGYLHGDAIRTILASDIDAEALSTAERNLSLLTLAGLDKRIEDLSAMLADFGKASHADALASARKLRQRLLALDPPEGRTFKADIADARAMREGLAGTRVEVVIADVPYGKRSAWQGGASPAAEPNPVGLMLMSLLPVLDTTSVVAIVSDKKQLVAHPAYLRVEQFQIGKRRVVILQPRPGDLTH